MKTLLIKLNAIGDVLFATPLLEAIRASDPDGTIDWLVGRHSEPILRGHPSIAERIVYDGPWLVNAPVALMGYRKVVLRLRENAYDRVFLLHRRPASQLLARATRAPIRVGFEGAISRWTMTHTVAFDPTLHETERYLNLLRVFHPDVAAPPTRIGFTEEAEVTAELLIGERDLREPRIAIAPGGGRNPGTEMLIKRWPAERYAEAARVLAAETGGSILVVGTPDEQELCAAVAAAVGERACDLCGRTTLPQLAAILARCQVMIANDSGPLHIAAAAGTPTVALFGPTDPRLVAPRGPLHRYLWAPPECGPCYRPDNARSRKIWTCDRTGDPLRCLRDIPTEWVVSAALEALAGTPYASDLPYHGPASGEHGERD